MICEPEDTYPLFEKFTSLKSILVCNNGGTGIDVDRNDYYKHLQEES